MTVKRVKRPNRLISASQSRGVALIMALMVFALVAAIAASIMSQLARERSLLDQMQSTAALKQQLLGGESWARYAFAKLDESELPNLEGSRWVLLDQNFALDNPGDSMRVVVVDRQGCYNVNRLADEALSNAALSEVKRLFASLSVDSALAEPLKDWLDKDQDITGSDGHEDEYYLGLTPAYRTSDSRLISETEFDLLQWDDETKTSLIPWLCLWPENLGINVNRMSEELLVSMIDNISTQHKEAILAQMESSGFETLDDFLNNTNLTSYSLEKTDWRKDILLVDVFVDVTLDDRSMSLHSKLYQSEDGPVISYYRAYGPNKKLQKMFGIEALEE
ncbi:type II secretion system minor pseudopilin GspK [Marinomonas sp. PE14-40]|uniref:type II secretion system minor pseudopilin GspK n=1 Tax=Marinomonas sp. PE14-40 TaxID=3060621 RepID=UPI003F66331D